MVVIKRALISVSDKSGIVPFAKGLEKMGVEIISTGGTAKLLEENGIETTHVSDLTGFPEMMDGRVKTLHPAVHGGILALRDSPEHMRELREKGFHPIDMVVVNLYPFERVIKREDATFAEAVENIDIGGPTMIRSAAKNHQSVAVVVNPDRYEELLKEMEESGCSLSPETRSTLALEAFQHTSRYDAIISRYLQERGIGELFPDSLTLAYDKVQDLRYGENPNQKAAFYRDPRAKGVTVAGAEKLHGKELSYNNILDLDAALEIVSEFEKPTAAVIKHTNPCGVACADSIWEAYVKAHGTDPLSAFGSVVGLNREVDKETAAEIHKYFVEAVIAPDFEEDALNILKKKKNIRLLRTNRPIVKEKHVEHRLMKVKGGLLIQTGEFGELDPSKLKVVTKRKPTEEEKRGLIFAFKVVRHVKSNSILLVQGEETVGIGAGQMSRVDSAIIAARKAGERAKGSQMASDAFFPFRDGVDEAAKVGVAAIIQPGGSIRDQEVIDAANEHNIAMVFSGIRLFKH